MTRFQQTLKTERFFQTTQSTIQRLANGIAVAIVQLRIARAEKKQCPRHWKERSHSLPAARAALVLQSPSASGSGRSERGHNVHERCRRGRVGRQGNRTRWPKRRSQFSRTLRMPGAAVQTDEDCAKAALAVVPHAVPTKQ